AANCLATMLEHRLTGGSLLFLFLFERQNHDALFIEPDGALAPGARFGLSDSERVAVDFVDGLHGFLLFARVAASSVDMFWLLRRVELNSDRRFLLLAEVLHGEVVTSEGPG